jgi:fatty acid desaturase
MFEDLQKTFESGHSQFLEATNNLELTQALFLNENFHLEHHLFPTAPSYNLSKLHKLIWKRLPEALYSESYFHFLYKLVKAGLKNDLAPQGIVHPNKKI